VGEEVIGKEEDGTGSRCRKEGRGKKVYYLMWAGA
jgi:hypothetical protein